MGLGEETDIVPVPSQQVKPTDMIRKIAFEIGIPLPDDAFQMPEFVSTDFKNEFSANVPEEKYHTDLSALSRSDVHAYLKTPAHVRARRQTVYTPQPTSEALRFGRLVHCAILEPESFKDRFVIEPIFEGYTKKGELTKSLQCQEVKEKKDAWLKNLHPGAIITSQEDMVHLFCMAKSILQNQIARRLFEGALFEMTGYYRDPVTGLKCRIRPDMINPDMMALIDLKTAKSAEIRQFENSGWNNRYDLQVAMYSSGIEVITSKLPKICAHIVVEKEPPYGCAVYTVKKEALDVGMKDYRKGLNGIAECVQTNNWPSYGYSAQDGMEIAMEAGLPRYVQYLLEERN